MTKFQGNLLRNLISKATNSSSWLLYSNKISNSSIEEIYQVGMESGASGGKILGAGNGGFMMFIADPKFHKIIRNKLSNLKEVKFNFDRFGSEIILNTN